MGQCKHGQFFDTDQIAEQTDISENVFILTSEHLLLSTSQHMDKYRHLEIIKHTCACRDVDVIYVSGECNQFCLLKEIHGITIIR